MRTNRIDQRLLPPKYWEALRVPLSRLKFRDEAQRQRVRGLAAEGAPLYLVSPVSGQAVRVSSRAPWAQMGEIP